ncbi:MAG: GAF domain-containing protein [Rectinemataceae bacterium]
MADHAVAREIKRRSCFLDLLGEVIQAIIHSDSRERLLAKVCRLSVEKTAIDVAWICLLDSRTGDLGTVASYSRDRISTIADELCMGNIQSWLCNPDRAAHEGQSLVTYNCKETICDNLIENTPGNSSYRCCASFVLGMQGRLFGTLSLLSGQSGILQACEIALLEEVARILSIALGDFEDRAGKKRTEEALSENRGMRQTTYEDNSASAIAIARVASALSSRLTVSPIAREGMRVANVSALFLTVLHRRFKAMLAIIIDVFYGEYSHSINRNRD